VEQKKKVINPHCPVPRCRTKHPHIDDPLVKALVDRFAAPDKMNGWVLAGMVDLRDSAREDVAANRLFSWYSRMRQPEELYFRTLYVLFIASDAEIPHVLSGDTPNSFFDLYGKVNKVILEGRGELTEKKPGLNFGEFSMIDNMNDAAHVGFPALQMVVNLVQNPQYMPNVQGYLQHLETYCARLNYMRQMFEGGRSKEEVLRGVMNMHRPASHWEQKSKEAPGTPE
jgi:hypothetical protein